MTILRQQLIQANDSASIDAFSRWRVSNPTSLFQSSFEYDLAPLLFEQTTTGTGNISYDTTNSCADITVNSGGVGTASMQSYEFFKYQPGKSQLVFITFRLGAGVSNVIKRVGLTDETNGVYLEQDGATVNLVLKSSTSSPTQTVAQASWNLDPMDGTGASGVTLDLSKCQILVIDAQWLGVGRVRVGFDVDGVVYYVHEFLHANSVTDVYCRSLTLPIRISMSSSSAADAEMAFICSSVVSEGGVNEETGYDFSQEGSVSAGSSTDTHILSIQPKPTFNSIVNRTRFILGDIDVIVTGSNPVLWKVCLGQAITGTTTFTNVNTTYSGMTYNTAGTLDGSAAIVLKSGYVAASNQVKTAVGRAIASRYPITLDAAGANRVLGRISVIVQGIGGASATRVILSWREIR